MKIGALASYRSVFTMLRGSLIVVIILYVVSVLGMMVYHIRTVEALSSRVYVVESNGNVITASAETYSNEEKEVMVKDHVIDFYRNFFSFDQFSFDEKTERALHLIGNSGKKMYEEYLQEDVPRYLKANNAVISIEIEELLVDTDSNVPRIRVKAIQTTRTGKTEGKRRLVSNVFWVSETSRSVDNPHGLMIEDFELLEVENIED